MVNGSGVSRGDRNRNARLARLRERVRTENAIVGIDLADKKQVVVVCDHDSRVLARRTFRCRAWDLGVALDWAAQRAAAKGWAGVTVSCEPTGHRWRVLGQLAADGGFRPGASLYGRVTCADVPNYSAQLRIAGVCNADDTLAAYGTFLGHAYGRGGDANRRPTGVSAGPVTVRAPTATTDGEAVAQISLRRGVRYPAAKHLVSILLLDAETGAPVALDYRSYFANQGYGTVNHIALSLGYDRF